MSLKDFFKKRAQTHEKGYVSFSAEDLKQSAGKYQDNTKAYELLDAAMTTSSHITEADKHNNEVDIDDIYPCTAAECDEMESLINQAEQAAADKSDPDFRNRANELREIIDWSRQKHWTFKWSLILGCVISVIAMMYIYTGAKGDKDRAQARYDTIDKWTECDTIIAYESSESKNEWNMNLIYPNIYKAQTLSRIKYQHLDALETADIYRQRLDTAQLNKNRKRYKEEIKKASEKAERLRKEYDEVNEMSFKKFKKYALAQEKGSLKAAKSHARLMWILFIYVIILIPAYIYSSHQYGYNVTRRRAETAKLDKIQQIAFSVASFFLGASLAMELLPDTVVVTHWSDGSKTKETESNPVNFVIIALKICLLIAALIIFCVVSVLIMSYVTIASLKRDHDWSKIANTTKELASRSANSLKKQ